MIQKSLVEGVLESLNFSKGESIVYLDLLVNGISNGSQISSRVELPKPSVYLALEKLYAQGCILLVQGKSRSYIAESPEVILNALEKRYHSSITLAREVLEKVKYRESKQEFLHLLGYENFVEKLKVMIHNSNKEIYMNTNIDLNLFAKELKAFSERGGRIIIYSFGTHYAYDFVVENYFDSALGISNTSRMICVADYCESIMSCGQPSSDYLAIYTKQMLQITVLSENIHNDIYKIRLKELKRYHIEEVRLKSIAETARQESGYIL